MTLSAHAAAAAVKIPSSAPPDTSAIQANPATASDLDPVWRAIVTEARTRANDIHLPISFAYAERLCDVHPEADALVVRIAILLHDTGWARVEDESRIIREGFGDNWRKSDVRFEHERHGCDIANEVLPGLGYPPALVARVTAIIDGHDTRPAPRSLEDSLVRDADRLWRFTATGIAIASAWFALSPSEYCARLRKEIIPELLTQAAVDMAEVELARSEALLKTGLLR
jgi:hypothetical protein